jgi:Tol biopolymer transport system component
MSLAPGSRLGPYEILSAIGAGGMGEVYRARDTKLNREVAIKVLPDLFALDRDRLARFEREAQTLAALNHPHIAQIYGIEATSTGSGQGSALVMELVDGDDLSALIARGAASAASQLRRPGLALDEVLAIASQIADALDAAHEQRIIHRDLKPANIKVRADGTVKVLDFGLAKAMDPAVSGAEAMQSPTLTARATRMGVIIGTAAYMAPEQARGKVVDRRADIWAFGVILFEMLTGRQLFAGEDVTEVLARVLERDPDWTLLPGSLPPALRRLIERCLTKDPKARLRDISEARFVLDDIIAGRSGSMTPAPPALAAPVSRARGRVRSGAFIPWLLSGALAVLAVTLWLRPAATPRDRPATTRVELTFPENVEFYTSPHIAPNGRRVAFVGIREGNRQLYVRDLTEPNARPIAGTDGTITAVLSPDGQSAAVIGTDGRLRRIHLESGTSEDVARGADIVGGLHWGVDGTIVFGRVNQLMAVPSAGGEAREVAVAGPGESALTHPAVTPDGRTILFTAWTGAAGAMKPRIDAVPMAGGARHTVIDDASYPLTSTPGRLLFQRGSALYAAGLDPASARIVGTAVKQSDEPRQQPIGGLAADVSSAGDLLFADTRTLDGRLSWVGFDGTERPIAAPLRSYSNPRVSPDGQTIAFSDSAAVWCIDMARGAQIRVFAGDAGLTGFPVWSPDGTHLYFRTSSGIARMRADGGGTSQTLPGTTRIDYPSAVTGDESGLLITRITTTTAGDVVLFPLKGGEPRVLVSTPAYEGGPQLSPDEKWITYSSNISGRMEVYLRRIDGPERYPVSTAGGVGGTWTPDGKRILFRSKHQFLAVDVTMSSTGVTLSPPKVLFDRRYAFGPNVTIPNYGLSRDGREFLVVSAGAGHLSLILNWLKRQ